MKVKESEYLKIKKPILKKLLEKLLAKYEYASILANDSKSVNYRVNKSGTNISEDSTLSERGFVVKIYDNGKAAEYSFSAIEEDTVDAVFCVADEINKVHFSVAGCIGQRPDESDELIAVNDLRDLKLKQASDKSRVRS